MNTASNSRSSGQRRGARIRGAVLAALGVAVFGLGAIPAQEAQAAGLAPGLQYLSATAAQATAATPAVPGRDAQSG